MKYTINRIASKTPGIWKVETRLNGEVVPALTDIVRGVVAMNEKVAHFQKVIKMVFPSAEVKII